MKSGFVRGIVYISFFLFFVFSPQDSRASLLKPGKIFAGVIKNQRNVFQYFLKINNRVFLSLSTAKELFLPEDLAGTEIKANNFIQDLIFIRDDYLAIVTKNSENEILFTYKNRNPSAFYSAQIKTKPGYDFSTADIVPPFVFLFSKYERNFFRMMDYYGINYNRVIYFYRDSVVYYKIGDKNSYALINSKNFRFEEFSIALDQQGNQILKIEMSNWHPKLFKIPQTLHYFLNGELVKTSTVESLGTTSISKQRNNIEKQILKLN